MSEAQNVFALLAVELLNDPDDDVELTHDGLRVHGSLFAFVDGDDLVVCLPPERAETSRVAWSRLATAERSAAATTGSS